jgi:hypothetical protein
VGRQGKSLVYFMTKAVVFIDYINGLRKEHAGGSLFG